MHTLKYTLLPCFYSLCLVLSVACCDDGGGGIPDEPGVNGANLPSGGSASNPAGKYVGHFLAEGWQVEPELAGDFSVCETQMVYIDGDYNLVVGDENDDLIEPLSIPLQKEGATYTGQQVIIEEDGAQLSLALELRYKDIAKRWEIVLHQDLDSDGDGTLEASGQATFRLEPRLDWTKLRDAANGSFDSVNVVSRPTEGTTLPDYSLVGGGSDYVRARFQVDAEGAFYGQGPIAWFYEGAEGATALITEGESSQCYEAVLAPLVDNYTEMTVRTFVPPQTVTDPNYETWTHLETTRYYLYGIGMDEPDFQQDMVTITAQPGSQIDNDTDGADGGDGPFFYFGEDLASGLSLDISVRAISSGTATVTPPAQSGEEPFELNYGYVRVAGQGYLVMPRGEVGGSGADQNVSFETFVFAVDEQGQLTGDGLLQGFDFPSLDGSSDVSLDEWLAMDNAGLLMFGKGIDPTLFDFVITQ